MVSGRTTPRRRTTTATLFCCGFFVIAIGIEVLVWLYVPAVWHTLYERVYTSIVWLPEAPESVTHRFSESRDLVRVYLYGVTNVDAVRQGDERPVMERLGPYVFQKRRRRTGMRWLNGGGSVSFVQRDDYVSTSSFLESDAVLEFLESESVGTLNDTVTTLNIPLVGVLEMILDRYSSGTLAHMLQLVARLVETWGDGDVSGVFMQRQVGELLFGYRDRLLSLLSRIIPDVHPDFALLVRQGGDANEPIEMKTGKSDLWETGELVTWRGVSEVMAWAEPEAVRGTDGRQFSPAITDSVGELSDVSNTTRHVWVPEAYRSFSMVPCYNQPLVNHGGVEVIRLLPDDAAFRTSQKYYQMYDGLLNISNPINAGIDGGKSGVGPKLFLSLPGFCHVDPAVSKTVQGVSCTSDQASPHIFLDVEPITGITVNASKALMLSSWYSGLYNKIEPRISHETFLPVMEVVESSAAEPQSLSELKKLQAGIALSRTLLKNVHIWSTIFVFCGISISIVFCLYSQHHTVEDHDTPDTEQGLLESCSDTGQDGDADGTLASREDD